MEDVFMEIISKDIPAVFLFLGNSNFLKYTIWKY